MATSTTSDSLLDFLNHVVEYPLISFVLACLTVAVPFWVRTWQERADQRRLRIDNRYRLQAYPFISDSSNDLSRLADDLIGPTATVKYTPRFPGARISEDNILAAKRVLVIGRTGIGKTREAVEAIRTLESQEADPVTVFRPNGYIGRPMSMEQLTKFSKRPVLLFDDIDKYYAADDIDFNERYGIEPLHDRLVEAINWFLAQSPRLHIIATAQDDSFISAMDAEQKKFWTTFTTIQLPEIHKSVLTPFIATLARECQFDMDSKAISYIARKADATYKGLIDAFHRQMKATDHIPQKLTLTDVRKMSFTWPVDWDADVFQAELGGIRLHRSIFEALGIIDKLWIPPYKHIVVRLSSRLYSKYLFSFIQTRVKTAITFDLKRWMKISPNDRVICQSVYVRDRGDFEVAYPALRRIFSGLQISDKEMLLADIYQISQRVIRVTGDCTKALVLVRGFAKGLPRSTPILTALHAIHLAQRDFANAIKVANELTQIAPGATTYYQKSLTYGLSAKNESKRSRKVLLHRQAIDAAKHALDFDSTFPPTFQSLAINYGEIEDFANAIAAARRLTEIRGISTDWFTLSVALGKAGDHRSSADAARRAVALRPRYKEAWRSLVRNLSMQPGIDFKHRMEAIDGLATLAGNKQDWITLSIAYGRAAEVAETDELKRDFHRRAIYEAKKALDQDELDIDAMRSLRINYGGLSSYNEAICWGQKLVDIYQSSADWCGLGVAYGKSGEYAKASQAAQTAIELDPRNEEAWRSLAINSSNLNDLESELAALESLASLSNKASNWHELSVVYGKSGEYAKASQAARRAIDLDPKNEAAWRSLSISSRNSNDVGSQLAALESLVSLSNKADDWNLLSVVYAKQGRYSDAEYAARNALGVEPKHELATDSLVRALLEQGKLDEVKRDGDRDQVEAAWVFQKVDSLKSESNVAAVEYLRGVIDKNSNRYEYWQVFGACLRKLGVELRDKEGDTLNARLHFEEAITAHDTALTILPKEIKAKMVASIWYAKARAFLELGNSIDACICIKRALDLNPDHPKADRYYRKHCQNSETDILASD